MERKPDRRVIVRGRRTTDKGVCAFHDLNVGEVSDIKTDLKETVEKVRNKIDELKGLLAEKSNKEELEVVKKEQKAYLPRIYFFSFITAFVVIGITWFEYNSSQNEKIATEFDRQMKQFYLDLNTQNRTMNDLGRRVEKVYTLQEVVREEQAFIRNTLRDIEIILSADRVDRIKSGRNHETYGHPIERGEE